MSSPERKRQNEEKLRQRSIAREMEIARKASLTMWERIEEADVSADVKEILHLMALKLGVE